MSRFDLMTSDDLDLRIGHYGLRTMLRYVTDPNHVDSQAAYPFFIGICGGKASNGNVKHLSFVNVTACTPPSCIASTMFSR